MRHVRRRAGAGLALWLMAVLLACDAGPTGDAASPLAEPGEATLIERVARAPDAATATASWVGGAACANCHPAEVEAWRGSHHDLAMQRARPDVVLGDFEDARLAHAGVESRFFRRGDAFVVRTDGADGRLAEFPVRFTFGVEPLQQYLVEGPGGRLQALATAWDSRSEDAGGQRWFHVYGDEPVPAGDPLHWTGPSQNWNARCAECHSTGYRKGYDPASRSYVPTWVDLDVACEACHGPGARHVALAKRGAVDEAGAGFAHSLGMPGRRILRDPAQPTARLVTPGGDPTRHVETCAPCHARRASLLDPALPGAPLLDGHRPSLLVEPLYFADGQIRDEVYIYGSFAQSRMAGAGVVCGDCHEPHSLALRGDGDGVCATCHSPDHFAAPTHTHHASGAPGCIDCHMPSRTYMQVDERHDHSFRVPRPDLAASIGVPDACSTCHADRGGAWRASAVRAWLGRDAQGLQDFATIFDAAERGASTDQAPLRALAADASQPAIVRATALRHLAARPGRAALELAREALDAEADIERLAALELAATLPPAERVAWLAPRLQDPRRAVRVEAARILAGVPASTLRPADAEALERGLAELREVLAADADEPEAQLGRAALAIALDRGDEAAFAFEEALALDPGYVPTYVNYASFLSRSGREAEAGALLARGLERFPESGVLLHAYGLHRVRTGDRPAALELLARAVEASPASARFRFVHAVAVHGAGRAAEALELLERAHRRAPGDAEILLALFSISFDGARWEAARGWARALAALDPEVPQAARALEAVDAAERAGSRRPD